MTTTAFELQHPRAAGGRFTSKPSTPPQPLDPCRDAVLESQLEGVQPVGHRFTVLGTSEDEVTASFADVAEEYGDRFTSSDCDVLADELHRRTGWPIVAVGDGAYGTVGWVHAGVMTPAGLILDVKGLHEPQDWVGAYGDIVDGYGFDNPGPDGDHGDYDSDSVWVHDARDYGWRGAGTAFVTEADRAAAASTAAREAADRILDKPAIQHIRRAS